MTRRTWAQGKENELKTKRHAAMFLTPRPAVDGGGGEHGAGGPALAVPGRGRGLPRRRPLHPAPRRRALPPPARLPVQRVGTRWRGALWDRALA
jgi:hypothetical protein